MHNAVMRIATNPFTFGNLAQDEAFTDRKAEIAALAADMRNGQDVVVLAPRRYGKTSLVLRAAQEVLADDVLVAYCDLMRTPTKVRLAAALAKTIVDDLLSPVQGLLERAGAVVRGLRVRPTVELDPQRRRCPVLVRGGPGQHGHRRDDRATARAARRGRRRARPSRRARVRRVPGDRADRRHAAERDARGLPDAARGGPRVSRQPPPRAAVDLQRPPRAVLAQREADRARPDRRRRARELRARALRGERPQPRRRRARAAARADRRTSVRDAGARVLHLGGGAASVTPRTGATSRSRSRTSCAPSTTTWLRLWEDSTPNERLVLLALHEEPGGLYAEAYRRRYGLPASGSVQRAVAALTRDDVIERAAGRLVDDRRAVPARVARSGRRARGRRSRALMRVWIDVTNSPHVAFFRPLVDLLRDRGHDVSITAREFAQTLELLDDAGLQHTVVGPAHAGASRLAKARAMASRLPALRRFARGRGFDVALSHASHELPLVARSLGVPSSYAFDYEFALAQHRLGCRAATRVVVPDAIPQARLSRLGARERKVVSLPRAEGGVLPPRLHSPIRPSSTSSGSIARRVLAVIRTPPEVSLYHRGDGSVFANVLRRLADDPNVHAVVLPRTAGPAGARERPGRGLAARPGARGRRAQPRGARRSRRVRRRDDEPRGRRARDTGVHDLLGRARGRRRAARRRRTAATVERPGVSCVVERKRRATSRPTRPPEAMLDRLLDARAG